HLSSHSHEPARTRSVDRHAVAMAEDFASACAYPSKAVHRHLGIRNDSVRRINDCRAQLAPGSTIRHENEAKGRTRNKVDNPAQWPLRDRLIAIWSSVRVPPWNRLQQWIVRRLLHSDRKACREDRLCVRRGLQATIRQLHIRFHP